MYNDQTVKSACISALICQIEATRRMHWVIVLALHDPSPL